MYAMYPNVEKAMANKQRKLPQAYGRPCHFVTDLKIYRSFADG